MVKRAGGESLAAEICKQLRADIFDRRISPGERLKPGELCQRFGVSLGVVREALGLLAAAGLVRVERNRGFHVISLSRRALADLTAARAINEGTALRLSVEQGDVAWEAEVLAAHHTLARLPFLPEGDSPSRNRDWAVAHLAFHHKLIEACGNQVLLDICDRLSQAADLYRAWTNGPGGDPDRDVAGEHRRLMEAAIAHDADAAVALFTEHINRTASIVRSLGIAEDTDDDALDRPEAERIS